MWLEHTFFIHTFWKGFSTMHQWGGTSVVAEAVFIGDGVRFVRQSGEGAVEHRSGAVGHGFCGR